MFTQCLIETIENAAKEKFASYSDFSKEAWKGHKNSAGTWRAIRNPRSNGKSRTLTVEDLVGISDALGVPLSELLFRVEQRMKMGWKEPEKKELVVDFSQKKEGAA